MCAKCEEAAKNIGPGTWRAMGDDAELLVKLFKMASDMNLGRPVCGEVLHIVIFAAARSLAAALFETFGPDRRAAAEKLEAEVSAKYLAMARCFNETQQAVSGFPPPKAGPVH